MTEHSESDCEGIIRGSEDEKEGYSDIGSDDSNSDGNKDIIVPPNNCRVLKRLYI